MSDPYAQPGADSEPDLEQIAAAKDGGAQSSAPVVEPPDPDDVDLLARMIFAEGDSLYRVPGAMEGIGWVARNRVGTRGQPDTLRGVIYNTGKYGIPQFQATGNEMWPGNTPWVRAADPSTLTGPDVQAFQRAHDVAQGILSGQIPDPTGGAVRFHTSKSPPSVGYNGIGIGDPDKGGYVIFPKPARSP